MRVELWLLIQIQIDFVMFKELKALKDEIGKFKAKISGY